MINDYRLSKGRVIVNINASQQLLYCLSTEVFIIPKWLKSYIENIDAAFRIVFMKKITTYIQSNKNECKLKLDYVYTLIKEKNLYEILDYYETDKGYLIYSIKMNNHADFERYMYYSDNIISSIQTTIPRHVIDSNLFIDLKRISSANSFDDVAKQFRISVARSKAKVWNYLKKGLLRYVCE